MTDRLPFTLRQTPDLDRWITFNEDGTVTVCTGKVELGQGIKTAIAIICAEELDVDLHNIRVQSGDTEAAPNEFMTAGSGSIEASGAAVRQVSAEARQFLLQRAAEEMHTSIENLTVENGIVANVQGNENISYWQLMQGRNFKVSANGEATPKPFADHTKVGKRAQRIDLADKVVGKPVYIQDMVLDNMVHGRILRPPGYHFRFQSLDQDGIRSMPGIIDLVIDGSFIGIIAEREEQVVNALEKMKQITQWARHGELPDQEALHDFLSTNASHSLPVIDGTPVEEPVPDFVTAESAVTTVNATYTKPFHMHGSIGPSAAVALWQSEKGRGETLTVWSHSQGPFVVRGAMAQVLKIPEESIRVIHRENAGCYGHNGADDAAMDAALLAKAVQGRPLLLKWTRDDEHSWEPYSPAMVMKVQADLLRDGHIAAWNYDVFSNTHGGRPVARADGSHFIAAWHMADPIAKPEARPGKGSHSGIHRNADPYYDLPQRRVIKHLVKVAPLRTSSTRGLGAYGNVFAIESFMDELAHAAGMDPIEFRLMHLTDERAAAVIEAVRDQANTIDLVRDDNPLLSYGRGMAFSRYKNAKCYAAVCVDLSVDLETSNIHLIHAVIAGDAGQIIDPDGLSNQLEGGFIQSASWTLKEQVLYDADGITSRDWDSYPILTFPEIPTVDVILLDHPESRSLGAGEATQGPASAAIANAVSDAVGLRLRDVPFTPERLKKAAAS
ncbi:MAG: molybdopterin-dependent oxidoreductase [Pseudomonadales bacterium]|jgi:CO/xanthine dehydrogenase Mo-binding subunit|nr:molybdopterin-dependent oxidoreductase [Pseudomonadales bacterium]MDP7594456.1 molybdopterin-dependent oxidoreductase [Pseudomonadales bacterium]HJN50581.1 molybdopterin cofactor-binding domain-containing protein [Pseudomonadales bacterium]|tara:strand:+ start:8818 stop:10995 length:2178 start_codon:yes stop_codon:yes gene_type:complete